MPGPVSDCYHPEFSTEDNAQQIRDAIEDVHHQLTRILQVFGPAEPMYILDLVQGNSHDLEERIRFGLSKKEVRILRFACERAKESI